MTALSAAFLGPPLAHRGYHNRDEGRPENSRAAFAAAIAGGYGIECDVQLSADGQAMVFHDYDLRRLTAETGPVAFRTAADLARIPLRYSDEAIPTLKEMLDLVAGRTALLIEIKDQDGAMGPDTGTLEMAVAASLGRYVGPVAVMSFNPHAIAAFARFAPQIPRGLVTAAFHQENWPNVPRDTRHRLREIPDYEELGCSFVSHQAGDLARPRVSALKRAGAVVLCWTVRSPEAEAAARRIAQNVTFEGYAAAIPPA